MKISLVIPVFNSKNYLKRCIDSIIRQKYSNLEIILVDDGSTDGSTAICNEYRDLDNRILVIEKRNGGTSSARNSGVEKATGDYITFVDADDWLDLNYISDCVLEIENNQPDMLFTPYIREYQGNPIKNDLYNSPMISFNKQDINEKLLRRFFGEYKEELSNPSKNDDFSPVWGKFYKSEYCKRVKFINVKNIGSEDAWFNINLVSMLDSAEYYGKAYYHYYKGNDKSIVSSYNPFLYSGWNLMYSEMRRFIVDHDLNDMYTDSLNNRIVINLLGLIRNINNSDLGLFEKIKKIRNILNDNVYTTNFKSFDYKYVSWKWKVFYKCCQLKLAITIMLFMSLAEPFKAKLK